MINDDREEKFVLNQVLSNKHVFLAKIISSTKLEEENIVRYEFEVAQQIKGQAESLKFLYSILRGSSCDGDNYFVGQEEYLIFTNTSFIGHHNALSLEYIYRSGYRQFIDKLAEKVNAISDEETRR